MAIIEMKRDFILGNLEGHPNVRKDFIEKREDISAEITGSLPCWVIVDTGPLPDGNLQVLEELSPDTSEETLNSRVTYWDGVHDAQDASVYTPEDTRTYVDFRKAEYPNIGDQLDMIYHAGLGGDEFQAAIKAVKDKYPKD